MQRKQILYLLVVLTLLMSLLPLSAAAQGPATSAGDATSLTAGATCSRLSKEQQATLDNLTQRKAAGRLDSAGYDLFLQLSAQAGCAATAAAPEGGEAVSGYAFAQTSGAYTAITGGSTLGVATNDDTLFPNIAIGFSFNYDGANYTTVGVCSNGYIVMGLNTGSTCGTPYTPISSTTFNNLISALGRDLQGNTTTGELRYETQGTAPNRTFTVQWKSYRKYGATGDDFNFQVTLSETSNVVDVKYGAFTVNATSSTPQVGLKGASTSDYNNRTTTTDWSASTAGGSNAATMTLSGAVKPASGQTYTWSPPNFPPSITYTALANTLSTANRSFTGVSITDPDGVNTTAGTKPRVYYKRSTDANAWNDNTSSTDGWKYAEANGASSPFDFTIDYSRLNGGAGVNTGDTVQYFVVAQDLAATPAVGINSGTFAAAPASVALTTAAFPIGGTINSYVIATAFTGTYTVPGSYPSLTNAGGIFQALNAGVLTGNVVIEITADLTSETGAVALNQLIESVMDATYTVTIKPSGGPRTISGTSAANSGLIILNGADNVTIDGSTSGGADQSLTITNLSTTGVVIWIRSASAANGAGGNTVKNCIINGSSGTTTIAGVLSSGSVLGGDAEAANSNNTIRNNLITKVQNALYLRGGATVPTLDQNWLVTENTFGSTVAADKLGFRGMLIGNAQNFTVSKNTINGVVSSTGSISTMSGIQVALLVSGGLVGQNKISDIKQINTTGWGSNGIYLAASSTASNVTVANNFVFDVASYGYAGATQGDNGYGIMVQSGGGYTIIYNSVLMSTDQTATTGIPAAINIASGVTTAGAIDLRNNIFANIQTVGTRYAIYSAAPNTVFSTINYNNYYPGTGTLGYLGAAQATLAAWQAATGQDANSVVGDPLFVSSTDLHITNESSPASNAGTPIAGITIDIDSDLRSTVMPDIGADEFGAVPEPAITLDKTVGTDDSVCATTDEITLPYGGGDVTYCYEVTNTGDVTLNLHDLDDSELGSLLSGFNYALAPGASAFITETTNIAVTTVNTATWTAYNTGGPSVQATDAATVTVEGPAPAIVLTKTVGTDTTVCATSDAITVPANTDVTYCYTVENTGNTPFNKHDLTDSELGALLTNFPYVLAPGASVFVTETATIAVTTVNTATWYAENVPTEGFPSAQATDTATVTVASAGPAIDLVKTVGTVPGVCAATDSIVVTAGTEVYYCYQVENTGDVTFNFHDLVDDQLGTILNDLPYVLAPGAFSPQVIIPDTPMATVTNVGTWTAMTALGAYAYDDTVPFNYIPINATGTPLGLADDGEANITIPFPFTFYGVTSSNLRVGNNGGILFNATTGDVAITNTALPAASPALSILPFWDDIDSDTGDVYWEVQGTAPNRMLIVEWYNRPHFSNTGSATFEVILYETSNEIKFQYLDTDFGSATYNFGVTATAGINKDATTALQYSYNQAVLTNNKAIRIYPVVPVSASDTDTATVTVQTPNIDVSPLSLSETHLTPPQSTTQPLTVANTGLGTLTWAIAEEPTAAQPAPQAGGDAAVAVDAVDPSAFKAPEQTAAPAPFSDWRAPEAVLYDNGGLITNPTGGAGGAALSALQSALGNSTYGFGNQFSAGNRVADDFTVTGSGWLINTITFFGYQTGSTTTSTFTSLNLRIWDGPPNQGGSMVVFGDTTTNRLASSTWSNIYRALDTTPTDSTRPIMANVATVNTFLPAGTYWVDWQANGTLASGPWAPPVTIAGQTGKPGANALQYTSAGWASLIDTGNSSVQDLPFIVDGLADCANLSDVAWLSVSPANGANTGGTNTPVTVTFNSASLAAGIYTANLCVTSNDPDLGPGNGTGLVIVPVTLQVGESTAVTLSDISAAPLPPAGLPLAALPAVIGLALGAAYVLRRKE